MKIAVINDTHFGARNDSSLFLDHFISFFEEQFFPYLLENNITTVFHLGDILDRRKYINFQTLSTVRKRFFGWFNEHEIDLHLLIGNHDTFYKSTNEVNSPKELFLEYNFLTLYETPKTLIQDGVLIDMIPWICKENYDSVLDFISNSESDIAMGHLELNGHEVMRGVKFSGGMNDEIFGKYKMVLSGHFHNKSSKRNISYLGTQYEITFGDANTPKGFHVLDTENLSLTFIENKNKMFYILNKDSVIEDYSVFKDKYVKYVISENESIIESEQMIQRIDSESPYDLSIIEDVSSNDNVINSVDLSKDTVTIINEEIDELEIDLDKDLLKKLAHEIFVEALSQ